MTGLQITVRFRHTCRQRTEETAVHRKIRKLMLGMFKLHVFLQILQNLLLNCGTAQKMGFL